MKPTSEDMLQSNYDNLLENYFRLLKAYQEIHEIHMADELQDDCFDPQYLDGEEAKRLGSPS